MCCFIRAFERGKEEKFVIINEWDFLVLFTRRAISIATSSGQSSLLKWLFKKNELVDNTGKTDELSMQSRSLLLLPLEVNKIASRSCHANL